VDECKTLAYGTKFPSEQTIFRTNLRQIISLITGIDVASIVINLVYDVTGSGTQVSISLYFLNSETAAVTYDGRA